MKKGLAILALFVLLFAIQSAQADGAWTVDLVSELQGVIGRVDFEIVGDTLTANYTVTTSGWCLSSTSLYVGNTAPDALVPSEFPHQHNAIACNIVDSYSVPVPDGDVFAAAYADTQFVDDSEPEPLGETGTMTLATGVDSYFDATVDIEGLATEYDAWCVDLEHLINTGVSYDVDVFESGDALVDRPENLDLVLYIINQDYSLLGATSTDVQDAIWLVIDDIVPNASPIALAIYEDALANGDGFEPGCGDLMGVFLDEGPDTQNIMITVPAPCQPEPIVGWAWASAEWGTDFGNIGGVYFQLVDAPDLTPVVTDDPSQTEEPAQTQEPWSTEEPYSTEEVSYADTDGDGFYDHVDSCPWRGNEGGLGTDETGCPYYDADWDGIYDRDDACPSRGNEGGLGIDSTGCPYYDSDGDGVYDRDDACPSRANEYGLGVHPNGCPVEEGSSAPESTEDPWSTEEAPITTPEPETTEAAE